MMEVHCPICNKRISDWMNASGKTINIKGKIVHLACLKDLTIAQIEEKLK